jgi:hypothetical protein
MTWQSRNKADLIIEVWEKLDCESVGASEIIQIEDALLERFGPAAVDSPMMLARQLADEGAELRHAEVMELYLERLAQGHPYDHILRNVVRLNDLNDAAATIRDLENIRRRFEKENDREGLRLLRDTALKAKKELVESPRRRKGCREVTVEMIQWLTLWLQSPEVFENWLQLRIRSVDFKKKFGSELRF